MGVVLLHSGITDSRQWRRELDEWPLRARAPELHEGVELEEPSALVGSSLGGRVAMELAVTRPALVERLVLVCPALPGQRLSPELAAASEREQLRSRARTTCRTSSGRRPSTPPCCRS